MIVKYTDPYDASKSLKKQDASYYLEKLKNSLFMLNGEKHLGYEIFGRFTIKLDPEIKISPIEIPEKYNISKIQNVFENRFFVKFESHKTIKDFKYILKKDNQEEEIKKIFDLERLSKLLTDFVEHVNSIAKNENSSDSKLELENNYLIPEMVVFVYDEKDKKYYPKVNPMHLLSNDIFPTNTLRRLYNFRKYGGIRNNNNRIHTDNVNKIMKFFTKL